MANETIIMIQFLEKKITYCRALDLLASIYGDRAKAHIALNLAAEKQRQGA